MSENKSHAQLVREMNVEIAKTAMEHIFTDRAPRRFFEGIVVSSSLPNANGDSFRASEISLRPRVAPMPLLFEHDWKCVVGRVVHITPHRPYFLNGKEAPYSERMHFRAEVSNRKDGEGERLWQHIVYRELDSISVGPSISRGQDWDLDEISVVNLGADPFAKILRCWTRPNFVRLTGPQEDEIWSAS